MNTRIEVLGSGQDGGIPHAGCRCPSCERAREDAGLRRLAPSLAVYSESDGFCYVIDASPHLGLQVEMIRRVLPRVGRGGKIPVSGFLLTHAHIGHYTGLLLLGTEVLGEAGMPVYCTPRMKEFLSSSRPFSLLVENGNIIPHEVRTGEELVLDGVGFTPVPAPHRGEITDTVGYAVEAGRRALYIPDTDHWTQSLIGEISRSDVALIDGTFCSGDELPRFEDVPHPTINETMPLLEGLDTEIYFTHINHTNPVHTVGPERTRVEQMGFHIACDGLVLDI